MRKLILTTSLALVLAACGGGGDDADTANSESGSTIENTLDSARETTSDVVAAGEDAASDASEAVGNIANDVAEASDNTLDAAGDAAGELRDDAEKLAAEATEAAKKAASDVSTATDNAVNAAKDALNDAESEDVTLASLPEPYASADLSKGQSVFRQCATCHLVDDSGKHRVGPNLYGVINAEAGHAEGFNYSKAMLESGVVWTPENIDAYLESPRSYIKGNRMSFAGLRRDTDRVAVIAYLMTEGGLAETE